MSALLGLHSRDREADSKQKNILNIDRLCQVMTKALGVLKNGSLVVHLVYLVPGADFFFLTCLSSSLYNEVIFSEIHIIISNNHFDSFL